MFRKILVILGFLLVCGLFSGYFYCAERYSRQQASMLECDKIEVIITNSHSQNFITKAEVADMVRPAVFGMTIGDIDMDGLERYLCASSAICKAEAFVRNPATIVVEVTQRNPVVRFQTSEGGFYCDSSGYILPLLGKVTLDLPIVSGKLLFDVPKDHKGYPESGREWLSDMIRFTESVRNNPYWSREIEQIWVDDNRDVVLYTGSCSERFVLGSLDDTGDKLEKMAGYYRTIRPRALSKGKTYSTVNLKYKDQIICK